ncbi:MAG: MptD family putative ECF transporter S component [Succinivibrionaceae bacterium]|nr:MptD family putative ECF transporter S component [Succinivibrionaceae bacterium]
MKKIDTSDISSKQPFITVRDLIDTGIFTALIFLICILIMPIGFIPVLMPFYCVFIPLASGIPWMLFSVRVKHFGPVLLMSVLLGILLFITGMGMWPVPVAAAGGFMAELIRRRRNFTSLRWHCAGHAVFSIWCFGSFIPLIFTPDSWSEASAAYGPEFIESVKSVAQLWMAPVLIVACVVSGWAGGLAGSKMLKIHFLRAGIV